MPSRIGFAFAFVAALCVAETAKTDVWDTAVSGNDNGPTTRNEIVHGFLQVHDLGAQPGPVADEDWYVTLAEPFSSYEVLCDGITGDANGGAPDILQRVDLAGTVLQDSASYAAGGSMSRSLRYANDTANQITDQYVRVGNAICGTSCDGSDQYHIRAWDTTIAVPRYNNSGTQLTVLIIQNPGQASVSGNARLWTTAGGTTAVTTVPFTLAARQASVINLATVNGGVANGHLGRSRSRTTGGTASSR